MMPTLKAVISASLMVAASFTSSVASDRPFAKTYRYQACEIERDRCHAACRFNIRLDCELCRIYYSQCTGRFSHTGTLSR
jgi:hypothetical protein